MDPLTAALTLANSVVLLASDVWKATPPAMQAAEAAQWAQFTLNIGAFITSLQSQINAAVVAAGTVPKS